MIILDAKIYAGEIPFSKDGKTQLTHPKQNWNEKPTWQTNHIFADVIRPTGFGRGRSAAHFHFVTDGGINVTVFLTSLFKMLPVFKDGKVEGVFAYEKCGCNYGLKYLGPMPGQSIDSKRSSSI